LYDGPCHIIDIEVRDAYIEVVQDFDGAALAAGQATATDIALMSVSGETTVADSDTDRYRAFNLSL